MVDSELGLAWPFMAVPVAVLLSGGRDSSLIVGLLPEAGQRGLKTFSVGFDSAGATKATSTAEQADQGPDRDRQIQRAGAGR